MQRFLSQLIPFILVGIAIVAFVFGIMLLAYLFLFGAILGFILFVISAIREKFFAKKNKNSPIKKQSGRIIDSDDWKNMQ